MTTRNRIGVAFIIAAVAPCIGEITEWTGRTQVTEWDVAGTNNIVIFAPGTFKFQSVDGGNLDAIGSITIDNSVTGTVTVFIERDTDDGSPGATNIGSINLTNASGDVIIGDSGSDDLVRSLDASAGGGSGYGQTWSGCGGPGAVTVGVFM